MIENGWKRECGVGRIGTAVSEEIQDEPREWPWPTGPGADFVLGKQEDLVRLLGTRHPIFLDTNFWVMARQAALGESDEPELISLLGAFRMAVEFGKAFFPVTSDLIEEFSKQSPERLRRTMKMVEALSLGVAMVPSHERMAIEIEQFSARTYPAHPPRSWPLWTAYAFALGYEGLRPPGVEVDDAMLVCLAELAWMAPPSLWSWDHSGVFNAREESVRLAAYLNAQEALYAHEIDSHETAVRIEIVGATSMIEGIAAREYRRIAAAAGHTAEANDVANSRRVGKKMAQIFVKTLEQEVNQRALSSLYISAMLHAAVRSEEKRRIKPNDIFDFRHASAALPHCTAFFTDGPLKKLITSGHTRLASLDVEKTWLFSVRWAHGCSPFMERRETVKTFRARLLQLLRRSEVSLTAFAQEVENRRLFRVAAVSAPSLRKAAMDAPGMPARVRSAEIILSVTTNSGKERLH